MIGRANNKKNKENAALPVDVAPVAKRQKKMTTEEKGQETCKNSGIIGTLLMDDLQTTDPVYVQSALARIADLCYDPSTTDKGLKHAMSFASSGGYELTVVALRRWRSSSNGTMSVNIQREGLKVFAAAAYHDITKARVGVMETIMDIMNTQHEDALIQRYGSTAVGNMICDHDENANLFVALKGMDTIVAAMFRFPNDIDIVVRCTGALDNLSKFSYFHPAMVEAGGLEALARAIKNHPDNDQIQHYARDAIASAVKY